MLENKVRLRENYEDYEAVKTALRHVVSVIVNNSLIEDEHCNREHLKQFIAAFSNSSEGERTIRQIRNNIEEYFNRFVPHYSVKVRDVRGQEASITMSSLKAALKKVIEYSMDERVTSVTLVDNHKDETLYNFNK